MEYSASAWKLGGSSRPVVVTIKGKAAAIVQDIAARADAMEGIRQGLDGVANGRWPGGRRI